MKGLTLKGGQNGRASKFMSGIQTTATKLNQSPVEPRHNQPEFAGNAPFLTPRAFPTFATTGARVVAE